MNRPPLLEIRKLEKSFHDGKESGRSVRALDGVSFTLDAGETLGLVGESGCGKSTVGRSILRLTEPDAGEVFFQGRNILSLDAEEIKKLRREMQIVFQDPFASFNPRRSVGAILEEPFIIHGIGSKNDRRDKVRELLQQVGLQAEHAGRYPREFSGGQRQRIGIARAIALGPKLIVADEPVSALDVSIRAQILNLLRDLQDKLGVAYLFISHDMGITEYFCDRVAVMYLGRIVEMADRKTLYTQGRHPYTQALLSAIPALNGNSSTERVTARGEPPDPANPPAGCAFHSRCPIREKQCETEKPQLREIAPAHHLACHLR